MFCCTYIVQFVFQDEDETDSPSKFSRAEMSQQFIVQLEERVSKTAVWWWNQQKARITHHVPCCSLAPVQISSTAVFTSFLIFDLFLIPIQASQIKAETQQNLENEMQKMQQKFKAREDKAKKQHREEMGQVLISQA